MNRTTKAYTAVVFMLTLLLGACESDTTTAPTEPQQGVAQSLDKGQGYDDYVKTPSVTVFATGLNNPRGLKFGPDGFLYVAEGGLGGTNSSEGQCDQVVAPLGPYTGGMTARISKISPTGERFTVADSLPSSQTTAITGGLTSGVADVEFIGKTLYAILAGAGCSHGIPEYPNAVIRVRKNGKWRVVADLSTFQMDNPVANPEPDDFEPDGTWYSMIHVFDDLYAIEPNHGELDRIDPRNHKISRVADISASQGHIVPTALVFRDGYFYVGNLYTFPIVDSSSNVYRISRQGHVEIWAKGFTTILGLAFDEEGRLYVLENTTGNPMPTPGTGTILRLDKWGKRDTVATGLFLPTAMTFGPDGDLYVSNKGFGPAIPGFGEILRIDVGGRKYHFAHRRRDD